MIQALKCEFQNSAILSIFSLLQENLSSSQKYVYVQPGVVVVSAFNLSTWELHTDTLSQTKYVCVLSWYIKW